MLWRLANDLLGKVGQQKDALGNMRVEEILDVLRHLCPTPRGVHELFLHVVGVNYRNVRGILLCELVRHIKRNL